MWWRRPWVLSKDGDGVGGGGGGEAGRLSGQQGLLELGPPLDEELGKRAVLPQLDRLLLLEHQEGVEFLRHLHAGQGSASTQAGTRCNCIRATGPLYKLGMGLRNCTSDYVAHRL